MLIFCKLILGHFIADFALQTNKVANWKRESQWGMSVHVLCHPLVYLFLVSFEIWPRIGFSSHYLTMPWVQGPGFALNGWVCIALISLLHWVEDEWRVWSIRKGTPDSTAFLLWDQAVHLAVILAFAPMIAGTRAESWVLVATGVIILAHFTSVLIFFVENDLGMNSTVLSQGKYGYMVERLIAAGLFLLPGVWFVISIAYLSWLAYQHFHTEEPDRTWVHLLIGNLSVVLVGLCLRGILN